MYKIKDLFITCGVCGEELELSSIYDDAIECDRCGHLVCARCEKKIIYDGYQGLACDCETKTLSREDW